MCGLVLFVCVAKYVCVKRLKAGFPPVIVIFSALWTRIRRPSSSTIVGLVMSVFVVVIILIRVIINCFFADAQGFSKIKENALS
jgi:hypothetical protein